MSAILVVCHSVPKPCHSLGPFVIPRSFCHSPVLLSFRAARGICLLLLLGSIAAVVTAVHTCSLEILNSCLDTSLRARVISFTITVAVSSAATSTVPALLRERRDKSQSAAGRYRELSGERVICVNGQLRLPLTPPRRRLVAEVCVRAAQM